MRARFAQCRARTTGDDLQQRRCKKRPPVNMEECQGCYKAYRRHRDAYKKATKEAEGLEMAIKTLMRMGVWGCNVSEEVSLIRVMAKAYDQCLERAIQGREEHHRQCLVEGTWFWMSRARASSSTNACLVTSPNIHSDPRRIIQCVCAGSHLGI